MNLLVNLPAGFFTAEQLKPLFKRMFSLADTVKTASHNTSDEIKDDLSWADAVIMWSWPTLDDVLLEKAKNLKFAGHITITQAAARAELKRGIIVSETRHGFSPAVSEMGLALILSGLRKTGMYHHQMKSGSEAWVGAFPTEIDPLERQLSGKNVGIVGFGGIGQGLARLLAPFNVNLKIYDPYLPAEVAQNYGAQKVEIKDIAANSNVVVLCAAENKGTQKLFDRDEIALLKEDCVLVNIGRASLINMEALVEKLKACKNMTAMLDVFDKEPLEKDSCLRALDNAFLTPHRAGGLMESVMRILTWLTDDFEAFLNGKPVKYGINEKMLTCFPD
jgi:D-3-phosphoglycerate dehydrogenase